MAINNPTRVERAYKKDLHQKLKSLGALFMPEKSSNEAHVYHSPSRKEWIKVAGESADVMVLGFYSACPCSKTK